MAAIDKSKLADVAAELKIGAYKRHVLLCVGPQCCPEPVGAAAWDALKRELKDRGLSLSDGPAACYRTKVGCLRVCRDGPVAVVYPDGTWYAGLTADRVPGFVDDHLVHGRPVAELAFARNPLPPAVDGRSAGT